MMNRLQLYVAVLCIAAGAVPTVAFLGPSRPFAVHQSFVSLQMAAESSKRERKHLSNDLETHGYPGGCWTEQ
jgi:hypothetical protein